MSEADLIVAWSGKSETEIDRELKKLDPALYLDMEIDYPGGPVHYVVKHNTGSGADAQVRVVVWKEPDGRPKPLCHALVEQVKRQEGRMDGAVKQMIEDEKARKERERERSREDQATLTAEHLPRLKAAAGMTLPPGWRPRRFGAK